MIRCSTPAEPALTNGTPGENMKNAWPMVCFGPDRRRGRGSTQLARREVAFGSKALKVYRLR